MTQWNIWGLDNVGKINADTTRNYYLKDHLGSIRVVLNSTNTVISAQDYDAWGYPLENRTYNGSAVKYDFTGKERDDETSYDYFGARYYDSRIANWTSIDPLFEKHYSFSPYNYVLRSPIILFDPDGMQENSHILRDASIFVRENPWLLFVVPQVPYIGPALEIPLIILSLPEPVRYTAWGSTKSDIKTVKGEDGIPEIIGDNTKPIPPLLVLSPTTEFTLRS